MSVIAQKERTVRNLVRLRRAERACPGVAELAAVRIDLERTVGPTVTRAMAARLLSVSQTALDRWIDSGDVPAVLTPVGRHEVPLPALVDLVDAVEERRSYGDERHPLAAVLRGRRAAAQRIDPERVPPRHYRRTRGEHGHRGAELRSVAYHRAVAERLDEQLVHDARQRLHRWREEERMDRRHVERWEEILTWPPPRIAELLAEDSPRGRDLRQSSPFAGALTEPERRRILEVAAEDTR